MDAFNEIETSVGRQLCNRLGGILRDGIDVHRCIAAQGLGRVGLEQPEAVAALIAALRDEDEDVSSAGRRDFMRGSRGS